MLKTLIESAMDNSVHTTFISGGHATGKSCLITSLAHYYNSIDTDVYILDLHGLSYQDFLFRADSLGLKMDKLRFISSNTISEYLVQDLKDRYGVLIIDGYFARQREDCVHFLSRVRLINMKTYITSHTHFKMIEDVARYNIILHGNNDYRNFNEQIKSGIRKTKIENILNELEIDGQVQS